MAVRPRRASDGRAVRRVARAAWRATYEPIAPRAFVRTMLRRAYDRRRLLEGLADRRREAFVAERDGVVVGYADVLEEPAGRLELTRVYVRPDAQGRGAGSALLDACVAAAKRRGAARLHVGVDRRNRRARAWYERRGFVPDGAALFEVGRFRRPQVRYVLDLRAPESGPAA